MIFFSHQDVGEFRPGHLPGVLGEPARVWHCLWQRAGLPARRALHLAHQGRADAHAQMLQIKMHCSLLFSVYARAFA